MRRMIIAVSLAVVLACFGFVYAQWGDDWEKMKGKQDAQWQESMASLDAQWDRVIEEQNEEWRRMIAAINRLWGDTVVPTKKEWVDYPDGYGSRGRVNFDKGYVKVEVLVPGTDPDSIRRAKEELARRFRKLNSANNPAQINVLRGMIVNGRGRKVDKNNIDGYVKDDLLTRTRVSDRPIVGEDGQKRYKVSAQVPMVRGHIHARAASYKPLVSKHSARFKLPPNLVMGVIHTESSFNPMARSHAGAYGLMQLIPRYAGREAYKYVYGRDTIIRPDYLYDPNNNVELGSAYLQLLHTQYYGNMNNDLKTRYLSICAYNWGPTSITQKVVKRYNLYSMSPDAVYRLLLARVPEETRNYLKRVEGRSKSYVSMF